MNNKRIIPHLSFLPVIILGIIIFKLIDNPDSMSSIFHILSPFLVAFGIAYLINPLVEYIERSFRTKRAASIFFSYLIVIGILTFLISIVTPNIIESISTLVSNTPVYVRNIQKFIEDNISKFEFLNNTTVYEALESLLLESISRISSFANRLVNEVLSQAINVTAFLIQILLSIVISVYMLYDKEVFKKQIKRFIYAVLDYNSATKLIELGRDSDRIFTRYLLGKFIDSLIIGIIAFIVFFFVVRAPFALLLSVTIGITNMVPYFGPFIGAIPAIIITLFVSPIKALWVGIAILVIQQVDGLYLGPKILGDHVGVKPFWIISAITIGGALFGFMGMLLGVPVMAVIRMLMIRFVDKRLKNSNIKL